MPRRSIVVVGSSNTDMIVNVERLPRPGETVLGSEFSSAAGGKGANQAVAAARIGGNVTLVARIGEDSLGTAALEGFIREGLNVDYVYRDDQPSGVALILVARDGQNSIAVAPGANSRLTPADVAKAAGALRKSGLLLTQLESPMETVEAAVALAVKAGMRVLLNPAPARGLSESLLRQVWLLMPNETEAEELTGIRVKDKASAIRAVAALRKKGASNVIITLGSRGAFAAYDLKSELVSGFKVRAVDTTGAGDTFNGALAVALSEGQPVLNAVRFANAAAAISVTRRGAQPSVPTRGEIEQLLAMGMAGADRAQADSRPAALARGPLTGTCPQKTIPAS